MKWWKVQVFAAKADSLWDLVNSFFRWCQVQLPTWSVPKSQNLESQLVFIVDSEDLANLMLGKRQNATPLGADQFDYLWRGKRDAEGY